jgi:hypothetical protein
MKSPIHHPRCIQPAAASASHGTGTTLRLHHHRRRQQSELPTSQRRHRRPQFSTSNLRLTPTKGPQATTINQYPNSNNSLTTVLVAITMLRRAQITSPSTLLPLPLCEYFLLVKTIQLVNHTFNTEVCPSRVLKAGMHSEPSANVFTGPPSLSNSCMWHSSIPVRRLPHHRHPCRLRGHRRALPRPPQ